MRTEIMYYKMVTVNDELTPYPMSHMKGSDGMFVCFTDIMDDGHEFGIQMTITPAVESVPVPFQRQGERAIDDYRRKYNVEHS